MRVETVQHAVTTYTSSVMPEISTDHAYLADTIRWADKKANKHVWHIVTHTKSKAFGLGSCFYIGWAQNSMSQSAVLERVHNFYKECTNVCSKNPFHYHKARFTLKHYKDKGFTGGFFQQWDKNYPRSCSTLDYTPETLPSVLKSFADWCDKYFTTEKYTLDGKYLADANLVIDPGFSKS